MKRLLVLLLTMTMLLPVCAFAATLEDQHGAENVVYMGTASNTYVVASAEGYQIFNANGEATGPVWGNMGPKQNGLFYQVLNNGGYSVVHADGTLVLADDYFAFASPGDGWLLGIVMIPTEDADCDYVSKAGDKMNISHVDVAYGNQVIGSIPRGTYLADCSTGVMGDYLYILHADGYCIWYDNQLNKQEEYFVQEEEPAEFEIQNGKWYHMPSLRKAFVAGSTVTADEVEQSAMIIGNQLVDIKGDVMLTLPENVTASRIEGGCVYVETATGVGLYGLDGKELIPAVNMELAANLVGYFPTGYQGVLDQDGHLCFYDHTGAQTAAFTDYKLSSYNLMGFAYNSPIMAVNLGDGLALISATNGLLPGRYEKVDIGYYGQQIAAVQLNGMWGCVDMAGNEVVPFAMVSAPDISDDGTLVIGEMADGTYTVFNIAY